jgi:TonB family protein
MRFTACFIAVAAFASPFLRADVTVRYRSEIEPAALVPKALSGDSVVRVKGAKCISTFGNFTVLMDVAAGRVTLVDTVRNSFATLPVDEFRKAIGEAMPDVSFDQMQEFAGMMGADKSAPVTRQTGRTDTIQGIQVEEEEYIFAMDIPAGDTEKLSMKMVARRWSPTPAEFRRVQALRELAASDIWRLYLTRMPPGIPGAHSAGVVLKLETEFSMSGMPGSGGTAYHQKLEVAELSAAPLDDSLFQVPAAYAAVPVARLIKSFSNSLFKPDAAIAAPNTASDVKAYVPRLSPLEQTEPDYPEAARAQHIGGTVDLLVTIDSEGGVRNAEPLSGPQPLRSAALETVRKWKFRPVLRNGRPVVALTTQTVPFYDRDSRNLVPSNVQEMMAATERTRALEEQFPRTPQQVFLDLEQDAGGRDATQRFYMLDELAYGAYKAGADDKAAAYANELLKSAGDNRDDWNYGNAIFDAHTVLGLLAIRHDDIAAARAHLLDAGNTPGSPQLDSFGPDMVLAKALLEKGDRGAVLDFLAACGKFWKAGRTRLDAWSEAVRKGETPRFEMNLRQ